MPSPIKFTNFAHGQLAAPLTDSSLSLTLEVGQGARFPVLGAGEYCYVTLEDEALNREIVRVTSRAGDSLTIVRGQDSTAARAWGAGDSVALRLNAQAIEDVMARASVTGIANGGTGADNAVDARVNLGVGTVPQNTEVANYELAPTDVGGHVRITAGNITVPAGVFTAGDVVSVYNAASDSATVNSAALSATAASSTLTITDAGHGAILGETITLAGATPLSRQTFTANTSTEVITWATYSPTNGDAVRVSSTGTLPAPLVAGTTYYVRSAAGTTSQLAATVGGAAINLTTTGTGTHSIELVAGMGAGVTNGDHVVTEVVDASVFRVDVGTAATTADTGSGGGAITVSYRNTRFIEPELGVTMYWADAATGTRKLRQRGLATLLCVGADEFVIGGQGVE